MKRKFTFLTAVFALLAILAFPKGMMGQTRTEVVAYTLDGTQTGGSSGYDTESDITQNNVSWKVKGNTTMNPWRIGGKSISNVDRPMYSTTPIADNITKIEVTHGTANNITVNSWTVIVATDASFNNVVSTLTPTFTANATTTINRPTGADWSNCYYKFVYNVSVSGSTNRFIQFSQAKFYKEESAGPVIATPTFDPAGGDYATTQNVTISCETQGSTIYYTTDGTTPDNTSTQYTGAITVSETTTIKAIAYVGNDASSVASATYTIMQPLTTMQAIFDKATEVGSTATYTYITLGDWVVSGVSTNGKNVFVTDGTKGFVIFDNGANMGFAAGDILSGTVYCKVQLYNGFAELTLLNSTTDGVSVTTGGTVTAANIAMADLAGVNTGALVHYENLTCSVQNNKYYLSDGTTTIQVFNSLYAFGSTLVNDHVYNITGVYQQYTTNTADTKEVLPRSTDDIEEVVPTEPTILVNPATVNAPFEGADGNLTVTYENITEVVAEVVFYSATGEPATYDWIEAMIYPNNDVYYVIDANEGEARTAYLKVYALDDNGEDVYSNIVTIQQAEYVAPTYAELPFEFNGGRDDIETTDGLYQEGLGSDYNTSSAPTTRLKFDNAGDWLLLQFEERPGTLTFDIKGNGYLNSTFKVQTSEDGTSYTDLVTYSSLDDTQNEEFTNLGENVRYIKWIYDTKVNGNVGLGNITLAKYEAPVPTITVESTTIEATAEETQGTLNVTYTEIETDLGVEIHWFESDGTTTTTEPAWISTDVNDEFNIDYMIDANDGAARTACFRVYGLDIDGEDVYSELVTVTQAGVSQEFDLTVEPFENLDLITFVNDELEMEGEGTTIVTAGAQVMLSIVANEGFVIETLMVNGEDHAGDIADDFTYSFEMPAENVTISATAVEAPEPVGGDFVRISSLNQLTDGSIVVIAARHDNTANSYYAMTNTTSGKPTGVEFASTNSGNNEILPASIVDNEDDYYWVVNETENGFTFTNSEGFMIGYNSSTNFATGGSNTEWSIELSTSEETAMVGDYTGFVIKNYNNPNRAFAFNGSAFGAYATSNIAGSSYNFFLDFFVQTTVVTNTLEIEACGENAGGYYLIASPVSSVTPSAENGFITSDDFGRYDLYYFDQTQVQAEWRNYKAGAFDIESGKGYLYASEYGTTLTFEGRPYDGNGVVPLNYDDNATDKCKGWNLIGNPFGTTATIPATRSYYIMNPEGRGELIAGTTHSIAAMEGIFVKASAEGETVTFEETGSKRAVDSRVVLNIIGNNDNLVDRAIVRFDEGGTLPKFMMNENNTKVYIPQDNQNYAVVSSEGNGSIPVNFKAAKMGKYTISVSIEGVDMDYLHLIDRLTGEDVNLLIDNSYSFVASSQDMESRFILSFTANGNIAGADEPFAYQNGSEIIVNGEGELQVFDVTGRKVMTTTINGVETINVTAQGVCVLRIVGESTRTQKIVVK